jgi:hypothetical protein
MEEQAMGSFLWFMFGLWVGGAVGFLLFACLQMSRDASRVADTQWSKLDPDAARAAGIGSLSKRRPRFAQGKQAADPRLWA